MEKVLTYNGKSPRVVVIQENVQFSLIKKENTLGNEKNVGILSALEFDLCSQSQYFLKACDWTKMQISSVGL